MEQWDQFHEKRTKEMGTEPPHPEVKRLVNTLKENNCKKILDHGCGTGRNFFYLQQKGFEVNGIDKSAFAINHLLEQGADKAHVISRDIEKLPFEDNLFDALISINVISHGNTKQVKKYINEVKRVVRAGGIILLVLCSPRFLELVKTKQTRKVDEGTYININTPDGNLEHHFFTTEEIKSFFNGTEIIKNEYVDEYSPFMKQTVNHLVFICKNGES